MESPQSGFWQSVHAARRRVVCFGGPRAEGVPRPTGLTYMALGAATALLVLILLPVFVLLVLVGFALVGFGAAWRWFERLCAPGSRDEEGRRNVRVVVRQP